MMESNGYGGSFGLLRWRYDMETAGDYMRNMRGLELRWYGINIPFTNLAVGFIRSVPVRFPRAER